MHASSLARGTPPRQPPIVFGNRKLYPRVIYIYIYIYIYIHVYMYSRGRCRPNLSFHLFSRFFCQHPCRKHRIHPVEIYASMKSKSAPLIRSISFCKKATCSLSLSLFLFLVCRDSRILCKFIATVGGKCTDTVFIPRATGSSLFFKFTARSSGIYRTIRKDIYNTETRVIILL